MVQLGEAVSAKDKPKRSTVPSGINPDNLTLETALKLLNLPILVGSHLNSGEEIFMGIGRFGPYLKYQNKFTSIPKNIDPFNVSAEQATLLIDQKSQKPVTEPKNAKPTKKSKK